RVLVVLHAVILIAQAEIQSYSRSNAPRIVNVGSPLVVDVAATERRRIQRRSYEAARKTTLRIDCALKLHKLSRHQVVKGLDIVVAERLHRIKKSAERPVLLNDEELAAKANLMVAGQVVQVLVDLKLIGWTIRRDGAARIERQVTR